MDIFVGCELKSCAFELPNGKTLQLRELTAKERGKLREITDGDMIEAQAKIVILGCDLLSDDDLEKLVNLPGSLLTDMADKVLLLSGLADKEEAKND